MLIGYDYDIGKRFPDILPTTKRPYRYHFVDGYYKSDSIANGKGINRGRTFKKFYDELCQHIFDHNLNMVEDKNIGKFPIFYSERSNAASLAIALSFLTPYVISEYNVNCKDMPLRENEEEERIKIHRNIDFWCCIDNKDITDVWIESKRLVLNVGRRSVGKWKFSDNQQKKIKDAIEQIKDIEIFRQTGKIDSFDNYKLALFSVNAYCKRSECVDDLSKLDNIPNEIAKLLDKNVREILGAESNFGILVSALDLRPSINEYEDKRDIYHHYSGEYMPFILLCGVVVV
ncbi:hypothetical protein [Helicobacter japonicus]|uniref:hypothetical protein n=1 Tax=Helicobacter japonicus TaxID=425400 RepID=UPI0023EF9E8A|nr:hypothetical protein [Helicobacter japonicus]